MLFADAIYTHRANRNLSIKSAAKEVGISHRTIQEIELRHVVPSLVSFEKLCKWAGLNPADFINEWSSRRTTQKG